MFIRDWYKTIERGEYVEKSFRYSTGYTYTGKEYTGNQWMC